MREELRAETLGDGTTPSIEITGGSNVCFTARRELRVNVGSRFFHSAD